jgi:hypothetical protein
VKNKDVFRRFKKERDILRTVRKRKATGINYILRSNCLINYIIEGKVKGSIEVTGRLGGRCKQLLDDLKEMRGYWMLKEEALDRSLWRTRFGRDYGPVVRHTTE